MSVLVVCAAVCCLVSLCVWPFCGRGTALSRSQTVLAHAFPEGVTRSAHQSAQSPLLPVSPLQTCVTCLRADQCECSKRTLRTPTRALETAREIAAPCSFHGSSRPLKAQGLESAICIEPANIFLKKCHDVVLQHT